MDEVFDLKSRNQWLRRRIVAILQQIAKTMFGDSINRSAKCLFTVTAVLGYFLFYLNYSAYLQVLMSICIVVFVIIVITSSIEQ